MCIRDRTAGNVSAGTSSFSMIVLEKELSKPYEMIDMVTTPDGKMCIRDRYGALYKKTNARNKEQAVKIIYLAKVSHGTSLVLLSLQPKMCIRDSYRSRPGRTNRLYKHHPSGSMCHNQYQFRPYTILR